MDGAPNRLLVPYDEARCVVLGGISRTTLWELVKAKELTKVKIGTRAFITAKSLAAYVDRLTAAADGAMTTTAEYEQCIRTLVDENPEAHDRFRARIDKALQDYADTVRFEVTAELLDAIFATGDGVRVTWRDATVGQHEERIETLARMITGTSETTAMHIAAVRMIKDAGVETLGQAAEALAGSPR